jgi:cytosine/adenosine deaminase-related metal-dependent hydrolase
VLPVVVPPIRGGWVRVDGGRVVDLGGGTVPAGAVDLGDAAILPGLVNAHTHLELSGLAGRVPPAASMPVWVCDLLGKRRLEPPPPGPIVEAIAEARRAGTALVGDVGNSLATVAPLAASPLAAVVFHELIGFNPGDPDRMVAEAARALDGLSAGPDVQVSLAVHAPYSCAPSVFRAVRAWLDSRPGKVTSLHLGESAEECRFLADGTGPWRELLEALHAWNPAWTPPGTDPAAYVDGLGLLDERVLAVHGVHLDEAALGRLAARGATLVTCPRSNHWVGVGPPPIDRFYRSGVRVALGTDSLASVSDLNLFAELAEARRLAPGVPARALLASATREGARALGQGDRFGVIEAGRRAALVAVEIPARVTDVEEYLVTGIQPSAITWLEA